MVQICENCTINHDGAYGSGRFCGPACARGFSTKAKRKEINERVSSTLQAKGIRPDSKYQFKSGAEHPRWITREGYGRRIKRIPKDTVCENCAIEHDGVYGSGRFCSKGCSKEAQFQRIGKWRKDHRKPCPGCGTLIYPESKGCLKCRKGGWSRGDITVAEAIYHRQHRASAFALIRSRARSVIRGMGWNRCWVCGYSKHVDAAHRRDIASFPLDTKLSVVNDPANLAALCRNHHWEFDHDMLEENMVPPAGVEPASISLKVSSSAN